MKITPETAAMIGSLQEALRPAVLACDNATAARFPPAAPGRGKRLQERDSFLVAAVTESTIGTDHGWLDIILRDAVRDGDHRTIRAVADMLRDAENPCHTAFSVAVIYARKTALRLRRERGTWPTKGEVRVAVCAEHGTCVPDADALQRWAEIFTAAGLHFLPTGKRGLAKKGLRQFGRKRRNT